MPAYYLWRCSACGWNNYRYRNLRKCPNCASRSGLDRLGAKADDAPPSGKFVDPGALPRAEGLYFATDVRTSKRLAVEVGKDGFGHVRAFVPRFSRSLDLTELVGWSVRLDDPGPDGGVGDGERCR